VRKNLQGGVENAGGFGGRAGRSRPKGELFRAGSALFRRYQPHVYGGSALDAEDADALLW